MAQVSTQAIDGLRSKNNTFVAYTNCTLVPEPGQRIDSAVIIIREDRIVQVGKGITVPAGATIKDLKGAWVYPGFVEAYARSSDFGDKPVPGISFEDEGPTTPPPAGNAHWNQAIHPETSVTKHLNVSDATATLYQKLGFTAAVVVPKDGIMRGTAATVLLVAGTANTNLLLPNTYQSLGFSKGSSKTPYPSSLMGSIALLRQTFLDATWHKQVHVSSAQTPRPEWNIALETLSTALATKQSFVAEAEDEHDVLRWNRIAKEAAFPLVVKGSGLEYRKAQAIGATNLTLILPLVSPVTPDVRIPAKAHNVPLTDLIHWYWADENASVMHKQGNPIIFTLDGLKDKATFLQQLRKTVERGLDSNAALAAITTAPATLAGLPQALGKVEPTFFANLVVMSGALFNSNSTIQRTIVAGKEVFADENVAIDIRGKWSLVAGATTYAVSISGSANNPTAIVQQDSTAIPSVLSTTDTRVSLSLTLPNAQIIRSTFIADSILMRGVLIDANAERLQFVMRRDSAYTNTPKPPTPKVVRRELPKQQPLGPFGLLSQPEQKTVVLKNATVWTCDNDGVLENTDVVLSNGKITAVGKNLAASNSSATVIDCSGKHITPGIIDEHSHIAISRGVNEGTHAVTTEVRIGDVLDPDDINIYRQLAGGVVASHLLHGSANPMGGQLQYIKLRWGMGAEGLKEQATPTVKFALGENVKQSNWGDRNTVRYPQTRMGVEQIMRDAFQAAREYEQALAAPNAANVRRDIQLDALVEILHGKRNIHCHSYVQSEILMLMRLAEEFGFKVHTFTHILEGYKVAKEMAKHGAKASSFADWWAYKFEVFDAIPESPAIMHEQGVVTSINSDDAEMARRLNQEAGKSVKYGNVSEEDALKFCTLNAAKQMGTESANGSISVGKTADVVVWSGKPLSNISRVLYTFVDGRLYFSDEINAALKARDRELRLFLEQQALSSIAGGAPTALAPSAPKREYHCEDVQDEMSGR